MTKEHRILFELSDLNNVRIVCRKCGGETLFPVSGERRYPPDRCPHCGESLGIVRAIDPVGKFIAAMQGLVANESNLKVKLKFEMEDESDECSEKGK